MAQASGVFASALWENLKSWEPVIVNGGKIALLISEQNIAAFKGHDLTMARSHCLRFSSGGGLGFPTESYPSTFTNTPCALQDVLAKRSVDPFGSICPSDLKKCPSLSSTAAHSKYMFQQGRGTAN